MAAGIERNKVFQAVQTFEATHKRPLPNFLKKAEAGSLWTNSLKWTSLFQSKVYISIKDGNLSFVELNWFNKLGRKCCFLGWHKETVLTDAVARKTLADVKECVEGILTASPRFKAVESLIPKAKTSGDIRCLHDILISHQSTETNDSNNTYINEQIDDCETNMRVGVVDPRFSETFLDAAIESARTDDTIWGKIEETLKVDIDPNRGALNLALLKEIRGQSVKVPCQNLPISEDIKTAIRAEIDEVMYSKEHSRVLEIGLTRTDYTRLVDMKLQPWTPNIRCMQLCFLGGKEQLKTALSDKLVEQEAYKPLVSGYLRDTPSLTAKLLDHTEMSTYRQGFIQRKINAIDAALLSEINGYEIKWPPFASEAQKQKAQQAQQQELKSIRLKTFVSSAAGVVADHVGNTEGASKAREQTAAMRKAGEEIAQTKPEKLAHNAAYDQNIEDVLFGWLPDQEPKLKWREQIANELANPKYQALIEARIKERELPENVNSQVVYCEWIKQPGNRIGMPELEAISCITRCTVIVVQSVDYEYKIIERINFDHQVSSFVFYTDEAGHFHPMSKIPAESEVQ